VTSHGQGGAKASNERRRETYRLQSVDRSGKATFHTSFAISGGPHGPTRGDGEQQLLANGEPPEGFTSYIFDTAALSDISYPSGAVTIGQRWSSKVTSFGKAAGQIIYTFKGLESIGGRACAKLDVKAGANSNMKDGATGTATFWVSLEDGLPVKKTIVQNFGGKWVSRIDVVRL
jgi:hypothetical protein